MNIEEENKSILEQLRMRKDSDWRFREPELSKQYSEQHEEYEQKTGKLINQRIYNNLSRIYSIGMPIGNKPKEREFRKSFNAIVNAFIRLGVNIPK